jgi:osmoprotectant transport system substrate-binding protein/osmoprotectant transport system permease protein
MAEQLALLPGYLTAHLQLSLVALALGAGASIPTGLWTARRPRLARGVLGAASAVQTIPSLALLAIMVPVFAALGAALAGLGIGLRGIGYLPALVALSLYSILPILRNTVAGIAAVDPALVEAARGVGMTPRQQLLRVELPLALPVIVAGLRTSAVWVVGTATLSTPVGATSLGNFIFSGLATRNDAAVLVGCAAAAGLALLLDALIGGVERGVREGRRRLLAACVTALALLCAFTAASFALEREAGPRPVAVGSKVFTEQYILAEILAGRIEDATGVPARQVPSLGSTVAFDALCQGDIDVYVDYSGTLWATVMKRRGRPGSRGEVLSEVTRFLADRYGVGVLGSLGFENTYALAMRADRARALGVARISDLARVAGRLEIGGDYEFFQREEWAALERVYGLAFRRRRSMDPALMYQAVTRGEVDVISAFSTDGRIEADRLVLLEDDRHVIPPYDALLLVGPLLSRERPAVVAALRGLVGTIDAATMRRMNLAVDAGGRSPADVAREFLASAARSPRS